MRHSDNRNLVYGGLIDKPKRDKTKMQQEIKRRKNRKLYKLDVDKAAEELLKILE